jgi:hypothetical protein
VRFHEVVAEQVIEADGRIVGDLHEALVPAARQNRYEAILVHRAEDDPAREGEELSSRRAQSFSSSERQRGAPLEDGLAEVRGRRRESDILGSGHRPSG